MNCPRETKIGNVTTGRSKGTVVFMHKRDKRGYNDSN